MRGHGPPGKGFPPQLLHVENDVGGALQQNLVVRDEQHRLPAALDEGFQPFQGLHVQVVGGLVQQVAVRPLQGEQGQPQLDLFPAGKGGQGPVGVKPVQGKAQLLGGGGQLAGRGVQKGRLPAAELIGGQGGLLGRQLLGQIPQQHAVPLDGPAVLHIRLHQGGVVEQL